MILDLFSELQKAEADWRGDHEQAVFDEAIEQARLADELGFGCWWTVEHHGATEFSYSSSPELVVTALAQHTKQLRFGHSGILAPFAINHPMRVAERAAVMDRLSGGRLELGLAQVRVEGPRDSHLPALPLRVVVQLLRVAARGQGHGVAQRGVARLHCPLALHPRLGLRGGEPLPGDLRDEEARLKLTHGVSIRVFYGAADSVDHALEQVLLSVS